MGAAESALHFISWSCKIELGKIYELQFSKFTYRAKKMQLSRIFLISLEYKVNVDFLKESNANNK
jgi:hypothetical protein